MLSLFAPQLLSGEILPFIVSGSHCVQVDMHPSSVHTFFEALSRCVPALPIRPSVIKVTHTGSLFGPFLERLNVALYSI